MPPEFLLSIAGITGRLKADLPEPLAAELRARYDDFLVPPAPWVSSDFTLRLSAKESSPPTTQQTPEVHATDDEIRGRRWDFEVHLEGDAGSGTVEQSVYSIDSLLRVLWSVLLRRRSGLLVHACGLKHGEAGLLFPGVSGAGKTTLARKARVEDVLSDEMVPIRRDEEGRWFVYASPFWGEFGKGRGSLSRVPLAGVGFLRKAERLAVEPLDPADATQRLLETILCFELDREAVDRNVALALRLATEVPTLASGTSLETPVDALLEKMIQKEPPLAPRTMREKISEIRSILRGGLPHAIVSNGGSMRPWIQSGDTLFIKPRGNAAPTPGDVLVYWVPGETEDDDALICHRMVAGGRGTPVLTRGDAHGTIERLRDGREAEILGTVAAVSRNGKTRPLGGRVAKIAKLAASLAAAPVAKLKRALR